MAFTHTLVQQWLENGVTVDSSVNYSGDSEAKISVSVADSVTDQLSVFSLDVSQIQLIYMSSTAALTVETNDGTTPADTIVLVADVPYIWHTGSYYTNLLATDITALYLTNASGSAATFELRVVYDGTP